MTTIAYDGTHIAIDGRETINSTIFTDEKQKYFITKDYVFFMCGSSEGCAQFAEDFKEGDKPSHPFHDVGGFVVKERKVFLVFIDDDDKAYRMNRLSVQMWADGSGRDFALSALDHGKSAADAVKYASSRDSKTGGIINIYNVKTGKLTKSKC